MDLKKVTYFYKGFEVEIEPSEPKENFLTQYIMVMGKNTGV